MIRTKTDKETQMAIALALLGLVLCVVYLWMCHVYGRVPEMKLRRAIFKLWINLCWLGIAYFGCCRMQGPLSKKLSKKIYLALVCYMIGDVLAPVQFLVGGIAYAAGHLVITSGFISQYGFNRRQLAVVVLVSAAMIASLYVTLGNDWRVPLIAMYIVVLVIMYIASFGSQYFFVTITIFLLSDVLGYVRKMFFNENWFYDITLLIYYAAILLYCFSFWQCKREQDHMEITKR